jgi:hypothetical protein
MKYTAIAAPVTLAVLWFAYAGPAEAQQSCGAMGGNYCSQSGSCPAGYNSLGASSDCNPCCQQAPSCGSMGGNYCSQSGSCPAGYSSLGMSSDCGPCCQSGPSCAASGGNYCSQSGSCPASYNSLGATYDCNPCCKQMTGQQMTKNVYMFSDSGTDFQVIWGKGVTESNNNPYNHQYGQNTSITSPNGRTASNSTSPGSTSYSETDVSLPVSSSDIGDYVVNTTHLEFCPYVNQEWQDGTTSDRTTYGRSSIYYTFTKDLGSLCQYTQVAPCTVNCADKMTVFTEPKDPVMAFCDPSAVLCIIFWSRKTDGTLNCANPGGLGSTCYHVGQPLSCSQTP